MAKRDIAKELIHGLEEAVRWKRGEVKLNSFTVELPKAADVPAIRKELGYSQDEFASFMGVSVGTIRGWEQARREPQGAARSLLLVAHSNPSAVREAFKKLKAVYRKKTVVRRRKAKTALIIAKEARAAKEAE